MMQCPIDGEGDGERRKLVEIYGAQRKGIPKETSENKIEENLAEAMEDTSLPFMSMIHNVQLFFHSFFIPSCNMQHALHQVIQTTQEWRRNPQV